MAQSETIMRNYEELAHIHDRQGQSRLRDGFLILAADAAYIAGWLDKANRFRLQLLTYSPNHLFKPFASFEDALSSTDIKEYIADLRRSYPPNVAEEMLRKFKAEASLPTAQEEPMKELPRQQRAFGFDEDEAAAPLAHPTQPPRSASQAPRAAARQHSPPPQGWTATESSPKDWSYSSDAKKVSGDAATGFANRLASEALFVIMGLAALALALYSFIYPILQARGIVD